ncbi:MAG TPA: ferritin-like domain-containing protein [Alphaproteobacteria bacterium]|nr:ferritin-like domain-containing protein [Alphaproteobacteria bacterium]
MKVTKAASMVEFNAGDYAAYLGEVFHDDPEFQAAAVEWAAEEAQHGKALAKWSKLADPDFDFDARFARFESAIQLPKGVDASIRGSRTGELIARCIVEVGTSSYYTAIADATEEPVIKQICLNIAADEIRHFALFRKTMDKYQPREQINLVSRLRVAIARLAETNDDELSFAYFAANHVDDELYDNVRHGQAYRYRAYAYYRHRHVKRMVAMMFKAVGLKPTGLLSRTIARLGYLVMRRRVRQLAAAGV